VHHHKSEAICFAALGDVLLEIHQTGPCPKETVKTKSEIVMNSELVKEIKFFALHTLRLINT
jgi:hypothetical protein